MHNIQFSDRDRRALYSTWERLGVKGPKHTSLLLGNLWQILSQGRFKLYREWTQRYGKVFGYYEGGQPLLVVSDPDITKEVLIKQFSKFDERVPLFDDPDDKYVDMFRAWGEKWKRVRGISTPTFSGKKMKLMSPLLQKSIHKLMDKFEKRVQEGKEFDISEDFKCLTLDVIATTAFSYHTDIFNTKESIFLKKLSLIFDNINPEKMPLSMKITLLLFLTFPNLHKLASFFWPRVTAPPNDWFLDLAKAMIIQRQTTGEVRPDYIQLMLNLLKEPEKDVSKASSTENGSAADNQPASSNPSKFLTMEEMQGQIFVFLSAGYETTATTLSFIAYYLVLYPDIQSKLQEEIDQHFPVPGDDINYETVQQLPYLEMVFCEVSRLAYIGQLAVQRKCKEDTTVGGNILVPKGAKVLINVADIHMSSDLWGPEPIDELVPERFLSERKALRHPMAYLPFGAGPKNCIGMRFAIMETKMTLISVLQRYTVVKCNKTKVPIKCNPDGVHGPAEGVFVQLHHRSHD